MIIAIDFDGTCVTHEYPKIGKDIGAAPVLRKLVLCGHKLILWTMRDNKEGAENQYLAEAVNWFSENRIDLFGVNENPGQSSWSKSPKQFAHLYIDDASLGCPLRYDASIGARPFADWWAIEQKLLEMAVLPRGGHQAVTLNTFFGRVQSPDKMTAEALISYIAKNSDSLIDRVRKNEYYFLGS